MIVSHVPYLESLNFTFSPELKKHLSPNNFYFFAVKDKKVLSILSYSIFYIDEVKTFKIEMIITEMKYRNMGFAGRLLDKFLSSLSKAELVMTTPYTPLGIKYLKKYIADNPKLIKTEIKSGYKVLPVEGYPLDKVNTIIYVDEFIWRLR